jgi:ppGpp synthetase/RelA/SpoT-type nucleotidyltranferase
VIRSGFERATSTGVRIVRTVDTRESGDELGYRAIHVVVDWAGRFGEIQLRTMWQQTWAQRVELADEIFGTDLNSSSIPTN